MLRVGLILCLSFAAEYVLDLEEGRNILYVYDKRNSYRVVQAAQAAFTSVGAYYHSAMRCLIFPQEGTAVLDWLNKSKRIIMTPKDDVEGAYVVEPLEIPDDI